MKNKNEVGSQLDLVGKNVAGVLCHLAYYLNDVVIVIDVENNCKVVKRSTLAGKVELHTLDKEEIEFVQVSDKASMFLFYTQTKQYLVNDQNRVVEDSDCWEDSYFDVLASSFYRKDINGYWYDIEGFRMKEVVFLKEDILISLAAKKSKKSLSFRNQEIFISKNKQLIQVGKILFDLNLEIVKYFGDKITGLGITNIAFEGEDILQEVRLGMNHYAFINEYTHQPFLIEGAKIIKHLSTYHYAHKRVDVFQSEIKSYGLSGGSQNFLSHDNRPLQIIGQDHLNIGDEVLIKVNDGKRDFYFDLIRNEPFYLAEQNIRTVTDIDPIPVRIGNERMYNMSNDVERFVIKESSRSVFKLDEDSIQPERIEVANKFEEHLAFAIVEGKRKLISKKDNQILKFGNDDIEISQLNGGPHDKFVNVLDSNGNKRVLDIRLGISNITMAQINGDIVSEVCGSAIRFDNTTILNVLVDSLSGHVNRVISINDKTLVYYCLPSSLEQTNAENLPSVFAGNNFCQIDYENETLIDARTFISASFVAFTGKEFAVILDKESGKPLHLEGNGHRNELASTWVDHTLRNSFHLGVNRMVCVNTISEGLKQHQLLFSVEKLASWLPFFDNYLPIMRQVVEIEEKENETWDYHLFELGEVSKNKEYLAVEKVAPFRLLADKKDSGYYPRVIKSKSKSIKSPEGLNLLQRIFYLESGELVEVE